MESKILLLVILSIALVAVYVLMGWGVIVGYIIGAIACELFSED